MATSDDSSTTCLPSVAETLSRNFLTIFETQSRLLLLRINGDIPHGTHEVLDAGAHRGLTVRRGGAQVRSWGAIYIPRHRLNKQDD